MEGFWKNKGPHQGPQEAKAQPQFTPLPSGAKQSHGICTGYFWHFLEGSVGRGRKLTNLGNLALTAGGKNDVMYYETKIFNMLAVEL